MNATLLSHVRIYRFPSRTTEPSRKYFLSKSSRFKAFPVARDSGAETKQILREIYVALSEKGYDPINQIVGYILSDDPTYITNYKNARALVRRIDRDELLNALVKNYLGVK